MIQTPRECHAVLENLAADVRRARTELAPDPETSAFYRRALRMLGQGGVPFMVGGAYAFQQYTGIARHTKDLDVFLRRADRDRAFAVLEAAGYRTECSFPHWLGKAYGPAAFVDLIWSSGNGIAEVDDAWFAYAPMGTVLGQPVRLCPVEEMIWSKAFIMERERFDGADVIHLIRSRGAEIAWRRLLRRFGPHWRVLLSHLTLVGFVYPHEPRLVPDWVLALLVRRLRRETPGAAVPWPTCRGPLLSRGQYLIDVGPWGYRDARVRPVGRMGEDDVAHWTAAMDAAGA